MYFEAVFDGILQRHVCLQMALRGYNAAGLFTTVFKDIFDCDDTEEISPNTVIDVERK